MHPPIQRAECREFGVSIFEQIATIGVVPVIALDDARHALPLANALAEGGLGVIEVTLRTAARLGRLTVTEPRLSANERRNAGSLEPRTFAPRRRLFQAPGPEALSTGSLH